VAAVVVFAATLAAPGSTLGPAMAQAADCPGASKGPRQLGAKRASRLVVCVVNRQRRAKGRKPLERRRGLTKAARRHTERMQAANCFAHTCPGEPQLQGRLERTGYLPCGCRWEAGENIGWGKKRKGSPRRIVRAWMKSKPHKRNLLRRSYRHIGVGTRWGSPFTSRARAGTYTLNLGRKG
jgi:uncharacterized protein YkwD